MNEAGDDEVPGLDPPERSELATQLARLNGNLERQFTIIDEQAAREKRANRNRWRITMAVVASIVLGNLRVEQVRRQDEHRAKATAAADDLKRCQATNAARVEIRSAFDSTFVIVQSVASDRSKKTAAELAREVHDQLAKALPVTEC